MNAPDHALTHRSISCLTVKTVACCLWTVGLLPVAYALPYLSHVNAHTYTYVREAHIKIKNKSTDGEPAKSVQKSSSSEQIDRDRDREKKCTQYRVNRCSHFLLFFRSCIMRAPCPSPPYPHPFLFLGCEKRKKSTGQGFFKHSQTEYDLTTALHNDSF